MADDISKAKSATQLVRAQQAEDGRKAMAEYTASLGAMRAKTEKLRALRLARDAAGEAAPKAPAKAKSGSKSKTAKKPKRVAGKLSDWIEDQQDSGRNT